MSRLILTLLILLLLTFNIQAQTSDSTIALNNSFRNTLYTAKFGVGQIGGYAQIDFNQPFGDNLKYNGTFDVHRLVLFVGHKFNDKLSFFSEIELEHVKEVYIEQAFLEYKITPWMNLRSGLVLIPMGIVNEYHEPPTFNGVERPNLDKYIVPTTWREIGIGLAGNLTSSSMNYQLYLVNGPLGYNDGNALFNGANGIRGGRQKGAKSKFSGNINLATKINYYGLPGLTIGVSGYFGKSQSSLYDQLDLNNPDMLASADSSIVGIKMIGFDARYDYHGFQARSQVTYTKFNNTTAYNIYSDSDLGDKMFGYFIEMGYDVFSLSKSINEQLIVFGRFESYNTHQSTSSEISINDEYNRTDITVGLHFKPWSSTSFKADYQLLKNRATLTGINQLNLGVGVWF
ncbi:MAG: hypothetical protein ABFS32_02920 [Bacteroidota bacterium]